MLFEKMMNTIRKLWGYIREWLRYSLSSEKILYHNWWHFSGSNQDLWFRNFVINRKIPLQKKFIFSSVFGKRSRLLKYFLGKKVFFTGENLSPSSININLNRFFSDHCINDVDLALGFDYINNPKYLRFPLWLLYFVSPNDSLETIQNKISKINNPTHRLNQERIENFVLIASHDITGIREKMSECIKDLDKIFFAGKFKKNTSELQDYYNDDKLKYLQKFKFNVCPENSTEKGYTTEKIFESIIAGCIPLYYGGGGEEIESNILNQDAFIIYDEDDKESFIKKIELLVSNENAYKEFCHRPPFKENAAEVIWEWLNELEKRLRILQS